MSKSIAISDNGFPRRSRTDLYTPAERAIAEAIRAVEEAGADRRLTDAVVLLTQAKEAVADFVERLPPAPRTVTEERWVPWNTTHHVASLGVLCRTEIDAKRRCAWDEVPVRVTLTYTVPEGGR